MTKLAPFAFLVLSVALPGAPIAVAQEYSVEASDEKIAPDAVAEDVAATLSETSVVVKRGSRSVCQIWLCKQWEVEEGFKPTGEVLYPFEEGELVGVLRFPRRGSDFRGQLIGSGYYTLRYAQQPVDGNHIGTSTTRDFLLLVNAEQDESTEPMDPADLEELSIEAARTTHPAMLALKPPKDDKVKRPAIRHDEEDDWWLAQLAGQVAAQEGERKPLAIDLVVVGKAEE